MKFLTNIYDPERKDAKRMMIPWGDETQEEAWEHQQRWLEDKIIGHP